MASKKPTKSHLHSTADPLFTPTALGLFAYFPNISYCTDPKCLKNKTKNMAHMLVLDWLKNHVIWRVMRGQLLSVRGQLLSVRGQFLSVRGQFLLVRGQVRGQFLSVRDQVRGQFLLEVRRKVSFCQSEVRWKVICCQSEVRQEVSCCASLGWRMVLCWWREINPALSFHS